MLQRPEMFVAQYTFNHLMFVFDPVAECIPGPSRLSGTGFPPNLLKIVRFCAASQRDETSIANER